MMGDGLVIKQLTFRSEISWDVAPLPFTFRQPETAQEVHGGPVGVVIKKG